MGKNLKCQQFSFWNSSYATKRKCHNERKNSLKAAINQSKPQTSIHSLVRERRRIREVVCKIAEPDGSIFSTRWLNWVVLWYTGCALLKNNKRRRLLESWGVLLPEEDELRRKPHATTWWMATTGCSRGTTTTVRARLMMVNVNKSVRAEQEGWS